MFYQLPYCRETAVWLQCSYAGVSEQTGKQKKAAATMNEHEQVVHGGVLGSLVLRPSCFFSGLEEYRGCERSSNL